MSTIDKDLEILALRSQLAIVQQNIISNKMSKPRFTIAFRQLWVLLSKFFPGWKSTLVLVKPETVIGWHKRAFKFYWRRKSKGGRPRISTETIALIKRIHKENSTLSSEKNHERLITLNIVEAPSPNTIAKYLRLKRTNPTDTQKQSWQSFLKNHAKGIWSMDFAVVPTLAFKALYVLLIISHDRRKIEHFTVTKHPTAEWLIQQFRNATPFGKQPRYLIHDNDAGFKSVLFQQFLAKINVKSKSITPHSPWQNGICERLVGIVRRELLDYVIPINQRHLECLLTEYVDYYNNIRTHQTLGGETPVKSAPLPKTAARTRCCQQSLYSAGSITNTIRLPD
jgi:transposase InsO family protein